MGACQSYMSTRTAESTGVRPPQKRTSTEEKKNEAKANDVRKAMQLAEETRARLRHVGKLVEETEMQKLTALQVIGEDTPAIGDEQEIPAPSREVQNMVEALEPNITVDMLRQTASAILLLKTPGHEEDLEKLPEHCIIIAAFVRVLAHKEGRRRDPCFVDAYTACEKTTRSHGSVRDAADSIARTLGGLRPPTPPQGGFAHPPEYPLLRGGGLGGAKPPLTETR